VNKFLRRLELINTNVETARNDLPITHDTFRRIRCKIKFRYRHCCVSVIMQPAGYLLSPRVAHGAIWDPWCRMWCTNTSILNMIRFPDGEQTGFCNSEPDWTGFWKRLYRIKLSWSPHSNLWSELFSDMNWIGSSTWTVLPDWGRT